MSDVGNFFFTDICQPASKSLKKVLAQKCSEILVSVPVHVRVHVDVHININFNVHVRVHLYVYVSFHF
jgi:hypothetical protein